MDLTQRGFGGLLSGDSSSRLHGDLITDKQKGRQVLTVQNLVQTSLKLTHGLLHLISMQKFGKLFQIKYNYIQAQIIKNAHQWLEGYTTIM